MALTRQQIRQDLLQILELDFPSQPKRYRKSYLSDYFKNRLFLTPEDEAGYSMTFAALDPDAGDFEEKFDVVFETLVTRLIGPPYDYDLRPPKQMPRQVAQEVLTPQNDRREDVQEPSATPGPLTVAFKEKPGILSRLGSLLRGKDSERLSRAVKEEMEAEETAAKARTAAAEAETEAAEERTRAAHTEAEEVKKRRFWQPYGGSMRSDMERTLEDAKAVGGAAARGAKATGKAVAGGAKAAGGILSTGAEKGWNAATVAAPVLWDGTKVVVGAGANLAAGGAQMLGRGARGLYDNAKPVGRIAGLLMISILIGLTGIALVEGTMQLIPYSIAAAIAVGLIFLLSPRFRDEFRTLNGLLFAVTFFIHIYYLSAKIGSLSWAFAILIITYLAMSIIYVSRGGDPKTATLVSTASIIVYLLPFLVEKVGALSLFAGKIPIEGTQGMAFLVAMAPLWPLYILHEIKAENPGGWAAATLFMYKLILLFFLILYLLVFVTSVPLPDIRGGDVNVGADAGEFLTRSLERAEDIFDRSDRILTQISDPGQYYRGQVEKGKEDKELGVAIENLRPQDREVNNESEIIVHGNVRAKSFTGGESVTVWPSCLIDRKGAPEGSVDPAELEVLYGLSQSFECTFPPMATGTYTVKSSATFPFETWSYITYHLVDEERARNIARTGGIVTQELKIPADPTSIYTQGPVILTMGGSSNPVLIRKEGKPILPQGTTLGITIDPGWQGDLQRVNSIQIKVPEPFRLGKCGDRNVTKGPEPDPEVPQYNIYTFVNPDFGPLVSYQSITCQLVIPEENRAAAAALVAEGDAVPRSFVAAVNYQFSIDETTTVRVR